MPPHQRHWRRAIPVGFIVAALLTALVPALPALGKGPVKVTGREVQTSVDRERLVPLPITASHVALHWTGDPEARISVAFGAKPGDLGEDIPVVVSGDADDAEDAEDAATGETYGPVLWTGGARFVRITTDRPLRHVTVEAIDAQADRGYAPDVNVAAAATIQPAVISRAGWGADEGLRFDSGGHEIWPPSYSPMQKAIVHHTAGRNDDPNPAATVRAIYYLYAVTRDYGDMGYNFLIDDEGRIYEGRHARTYAAGETPTGEDLAGNVVRGAHARDYNDGTVGIVLLGTFMNRLPSAAQRASLEKLLAWKLERHGLDPLGQSTYRNPVLGNTKLIYNISGHRNVNATACPGDAFYPTFPQLRQAVASRIAATTGPSHDATAPAVTSLEPLGPSPTGAAEVSFGLMFSEPVQGLEASDFSIGGTSSGWSVEGLAGAAATYTVTLAAADPDPGSVDLTLDPGSVTDLAGHAGPATDASASIDHVDDATAPTAVLYQTPHRTYINDHKVEYVNVTASFSEAVTGFTPADVQIGGTSTQATPWTVPMIFGSGASYGFSVSHPGWADGTLTFRIPAGAVTDLAGNPVEASNQITYVLDTQAPSASGPRPALAAGTTLAGGSLRATVAWNGSDAGPAGIASYDFARSVDGKPFKVLATGLTGASVGVLLEPGRTYRWEVRAHDKAGNVGPWNAGATVRPKLIQESKDKIRWSGTTRRTHASVYSGGAERYLGAAGASAQFTTRARSLSFVTTRGPSRGAVRIYVDGVFQATIDLGNATMQYRYVAFSRTWTSSASHTIKVVAVGTPGRPRVDVDAFGVIK